MKYFNNIGRRIPSSEMRIFSENPSQYYSINQPNIDYSKILERSKTYNNIAQNISLEDFKSSAEKLLNKIKTNPDYSNLLKASYVPFIYQHQGNSNDLGINLEDTLLPNLQKSFNDRFPESHFKAILQSNSEMRKNISIDPNSRYDKFIEASKFEAVVGWYFPQALQEFDIESQRKQMQDLQDFEGLCLSGGADICSALIGSPDLLINKDSYSPILCMSAYKHADDRLVLLIKSYGPHLEFWCMTQMLTKNIKQVSEQWAGGLTVYEKIQTQVE